MKLPIKIFGLLLRPKAIYDEQGRPQSGGGQMPNSDRSAQSINFGLFLRKAGGISNLMRTLQNLDLSTTARNFLGPFSESARKFRLSGRVRTCK